MSITYLNIFLTASSHGKYFPVALKWGKTFFFLFVSTGRLKHYRRKCIKRFLFFSRSQGSAAFNQPSAVSVLQGQLEEGNDLLQRFQEGKLRGK